MAVVRVLIWISPMVIYFGSAREDKTITAEPGQSVSLPCRAPRNTEITAAEWTRPGLEQEYVLLYRDGKPDLYNQHPSYQNRVELKDRDMKDGNVTMILKNVTSNDTGRYECRVFMRKTESRKKRASLPTEPISIVHLQVHQPGDTEKHTGDKDGGDENRGDKGRGDKEGGDNKGPVGVGIGLSALFVVVLGAGGLFYRKRTGLPGQSPYKAPPNEKSPPA